MVQSREDKLAWHRQHYKDNKLEKQAYAEKYYIENRDKVLERCKKYVNENREKKRLYEKQHYIDNKDKRNSYNKQYNKDNPEIHLKSKLKRMSIMGEIYNLKSKEMIYAIDAWSKTVRKRDNNKCTWCNSTKTLVSHHIWHKAFCPESALDVDNGITLCHDCHMEQHRLDKLV